MSRKLLLYVAFLWYCWVVLPAVFSNYDFSKKSNLPVRNDKVGEFSFINQDGKTITEREVEGRVYVAEYFFTTCRAFARR